MNNTHYGANCREYPFQEECAGEGRPRVITSDDYEAERRRMTDKIAVRGRERGVQEASEPF